MYTVSAASLTKEMALVESVDNQIGYELELESKPALLAYSLELLLVLEKEIYLRDSQLIRRDEELKKNIRMIEDLYDSQRYRIGRFIIRPLEIVLLKLGIIKEPQRPSYSSLANLERTD